MAHEYDVERHRFAVELPDGQGRKSLKPSNLLWRERAAESKSSTAARLVKEAENARTQEMKAKKYAKAVELLEAAANDGDLETQFKLGVYHKHGEVGLTENLERALEWYDKAATGGHAMSQLLLSTFDSVDHSKTVELLTAAAGQTEDLEVAGAAMMRLGALEGRAVQKTVDLIMRGFETFDGVPMGERKIHPEDVANMNETVDDTMNSIAERDLTVEIHGHSKKEFNGKSGGRIKCKYQP